MIPRLISPVSSRQRLRQSRLYPIQSRHNRALRGTWITFSSFRQLQRVAIDNLLRRLAAAVDGHAAAATFACGGSVAISVGVATSIYVEADTPGQNASRIQLRYAGGKIYFPNNAYDDGLDIEMLVQAWEGRHRRNLQEGWET